MKRRTHSLPGAPGRCGQRGAAIIMAMLIVALATTAASAMIFRQFVWTRQVELTQDAARARLAAAAGLAFVGAILRDDDFRSTVDHMGEPWAMPLPSTNVEGADLSGQLSDQQGLFNLNNLLKGDSVDRAALLRLRKLLGLLDLPESLANVLADWIDKDSERIDGAGSEEALYTDLDPARRAPNRQMAELNELLLVPGFTAKVVAKLAPFVTVLPGSTKLNVNTAPPELLTLYVDGLSLAEAKVLASGRDRVWFKDAADFRGRLPRADQQVNAADIGTTSQYFLVQAQTQYGRARAHVQALMFRPPRQWAVTVWQRFE